MLDRAVRADLDAIYGRRPPVPDGYDERVVAAAYQVLDGPVALPPASPAHQRWRITRYVPAFAAAALLVFCASVLLVMGARVPAAPSLEKTRIAAARPGGASRSEPVLEAAAKAEGQKRVLAATGGVVTAAPQVGSAALNAAGGSPAPSAQLSQADVAPGPMPPAMPPPGPPPLPPLIVQAVRSNVLKLAASSAGGITEPAAGGGRSAPGEVDAMRGVRGGRLAKDAAPADPVDTFLRQAVALEQPMPAGAADRRDAGAATHIFEIALDSDERTLAGYSIELTADPSYALVGIHPASKVASENNRFSRASANFLGQPQFDAVAVGGNVVRIASVLAPSELSRASTGSHRLASILWRGPIEPPVIRARLLAAADASGEALPLTGIVRVVRRVESTAVAAPAVPGTPAVPAPTAPVSAPTGAPPPANPR